jgi:signal transduction histidine kinase
MAGSYLIIFLKLNYNTEHRKLIKSNTLLQEKSVEVSFQNEELKMSKEALDQLVNQLEQQTNELMAIKNTLEEKVSERTEDLLKLNERLIAQNQQLEQYAYITSHNLRAPVSQIKGLINVLPQKNNMDALTKETLSRILDSANNLEKVFEDLSEIIKVEKGMQHPWQDVDLLVEIETVLQSLKTSLREKKIKIIKPSESNGIIKALRPYVYSVFHNIIENAVKYSDQKKDQSYIKIEFDESSKYYHVAITDNGIGIDMETASGKIFQMYQRFNNTHPGQGFGLFLVKSQMEAIEGKVELESILGQGTTFNLYFPKR